MRRTLALAGAAAIAVSFIGLAGPAAADSVSSHALQPGDVVIGEAGADLDRFATSNGVEGDYLEILNTTNSPVDVSGWILKACNTSADFSLTFPASTTILANDVLLIAAAGYAGGPLANFAFSAGTELEQAGGGAELVDGTTLMGNVQWGIPDSVCGSFDPADVLPTDAQSIEYNVATGVWSQTNPSPGV